MKTRFLILTLFSILLLEQSGFALTYYSRTNGNWTSSGSWSTVGYGNATNTGTYPVAGDVVNIGNGYTIYIDNNVSCATLNIGQGTSGTLEYLSSANFVLNVSGHVTVNTGARFWYNTAVTRSHTCIISGNFTNYGVVDFYRSSSQVVNLSFMGATNSTVSGTGTWDLFTVTLVKSTVGVQLSVNTNGFETATRNFVGTRGTYIHNNTGTYNINPTTSAFTIGPNMSFRVPLGTMWFAAVANDLILQGSLYVNGGNVRVGSTAGLQGIRSDQNGTVIPYLEVSAGTLTVYGGITYGSASTSEPFSFRMTGGTISLNSGASGTSRQVFCVNDRPGSIFFMSGGTIILEKPNTNGTLTIDFSLPGSLGTVTSNGGTVQFGSNNTASGARFNFKPYDNIVQPNFRITGNATRTGTLATSYGSTANFRLRSLYIDQNKTFDVRSIGGTFGDNKTMTLTSTFNGIEAFYNSGTFFARTGTVTFNPTGAQAIGGTVVSTFYNLAINNANNITLNRPANVSNYLSMVSGKLLTTNTYVLTCLNNANANIGSVSSYVDGPMIHTLASSAQTIKNFPIGKGFSYRPAVLTLTHTNATSVTYRGEVFNAAASGLPYGLPPSIANVSNVRYLRFTRQSVANFSTGRIQMFYDTDDGVADKNSLLVAHDNGTSMWDNRSGTATANWTGNITSANFNVFNTYFSLANPPGGGNPLPIELASFNAKLAQKKVFLNWSTQTEVNNQFFTIERSSDNINYTPIAYVDGAGNSTVTRNYSTVDNTPLSGISYYRLKQTDYDGNYEYFAAKAINNITKRDFTVFPNPALASNIQLSFNDDLSQYYTFSVQDMTGKQIPASVYPQENGTVRLVIDEAIAKQGSLYIITATDGQETIRQKVIIQ